MVAEYRFEAEISCIIELQSTNRFADWQQACESTKDCRYVLVATIQEIKMLTVKREATYSNLVVQESNLDGLQQGLPFDSPLVELEKIGRVFYAREGGRVSELTFQNTEAAQKRDPHWMMTI